MFFKTIALCAFVLFIGCDLFKSKEQLLTETKWELIRKTVVSDSIVHYSRFRKPLLESNVSFFFEKNGVLYITTDGVKNTYAWNWINEKELIIEVIGLEDFEGNYSIGDNISSDFLFLNKKNENVLDDIVTFSFSSKIN